MNRSVSAVLASLLAVSLLSCSHEAPSTPEPPGKPEPPGALAIEKLAGDGVSIVAGGALSPTVRVVRGGKPVAGAEVRFAIRSGGGMLIDSTVATGADGRAEALWFMGFDAGRQVLDARVEEVSAEFAATANAPAPGAAYLGRNGYVEYIAGELPIIISAPHGGSLQPSEIRDRASGTSVQDPNADDLARRIAAALADLTGRRPHLVLMHLRRTKLDANREIKEAAEGDARAERAWREYHRWIETAERTVSRSGGRGFYLDVHVHGHPVPRIELGYLLTSSALSRSDSVLNQASYARKSSIRTLAERTSTPFSELLRGEQSLGELLVRRGYPAVPSRSDPRPGGSPYFDGGYSTERHGSLDGGPIDGVQAEINYQIALDSPARRDAFARAVAEALVQYLDQQAGLALVKAR